MNPLIEQMLIGDFIGGSVLLVFEIVRSNDKSEKNVIKDGNRKT